MCVLIFFWRGGRCTVPTEAFIKIVFFPSYFIFCLSPCLAQHLADDAAIGRHKMVSQIAADTYTVHTSLATDHKASRTKTINGEKKHISSWTRYRVLFQINRIILFPGWIQGGGNWRSVGERGELILDIGYLFVYIFTYYVYDVVQWAFFNEFCIEQKLAGQWLWKTLSF